jgi:hypothetical protein
MAAARPVKKTKNKLDTCERTPKAPSSKTNKKEDFGKEPRTIETTCHGHYHCIDTWPTACTHTYIYTISPTNTATNPISVDQPYAGPAASCCSINGTHSI